MHGRRYISTYVSCTCFVKNESFSGVLDEDGEHDQLATKPLGVLIGEGGSVAAALHPSFVCFEVPYVEEL